MSLVQFQPDPPNNCRVEESGRPRRVHIPKIVGSNPASATNQRRKQQNKIVGSSPITATMAMVCGPTVGPTASCYSGRCVGIGQPRLTANERVHHYGHQGSNP